MTILTIAPDKTTIDFSDNRGSKLILEPTEIRVQIGIDDPEMITIMDLVRKYQDIVTKN